MIDTTTSIKKGKYLVYLPSYKYLDTLRDKLADNLLLQRSLFQHPRMTELEKSEFIGRFRSDESEIIGFAVISGIFGEGIDLPGDQLIGVIIVGVGLPQLSLERNLMKAYYEEVFKSGFEFAYQFPGFSRVMQAAGRTIRTAADKGIIVLLDQRYSQNRYRSLFPEHWDAEYIMNKETLKLTLNLFWQTAELVS
jgi:Rad3-related DNA helicase